MRLGELMPRYSDLGNGRWQMIFMCPACPLTHMISIYFGAEEVGAPHRTWAAKPFPPESTAWLGIVTITPSIDNTRTPVSRKTGVLCKFHGIITDGEVVLA